MEAPLTTKPEHAPTRKIIHIDMDAFYASVEQLDNPELKGKPVAVGGTSQRGVVAAASYEARKFGVHSAMPSVQAYKLCPQIKFIKPRFERYREISKQVHQVFRQYTDLVEPLSLDEAYLDVTENKHNNPSATEIAKAVRQKIFAETGLTASAGISYNKFLAKIASDINKPNGYKLIHPEHAQAFIDALPVKKFFGVGKVTAKKMEDMGIENGRDLKALTKPELTKHFGKVGLHYYNIVRGIDNRPVKPDRIRKSIGIERTFDADVTSYSEVLPILKDLADKLEGRMKEKGASGKTLTLKVKYADFQLITRAQSLKKPVQQAGKILGMAEKITAQVEDLHRGVRLLGLTCSNLVFDTDNEDAAKQLRLDL